MPIYEYRCGSCRTVFDRLRPMSRMDDEALCPECDGESSRQMSVFAAFSGSNGDGDGGGGAIAGMGGCGGCGPSGCACSMSV